MVEINNQRKAFLDMLAWSEGTDNGRQKTSTGYDVIVGRRAIYWLLRSPSQTCHAKPKLKSTGWTANNSWWIMDSSWKPLPENSGAGITLEWGVALHPMIDRDIRQAIDRCSNIWASLRALVMVSSDCRRLAWLQNSKKRAERSERLMYEQSHRDYLRSGYLHHRLPVMGC